MKKIACIFMTLVIVSLAVGCSASGEVAEQVYWPTGGWQTSTPEEEDMDPGQLNQVMDYLEDKGLDIHSVVVVRNGYIVLEEYPGTGYDQATTHELRSVTKSFVSALVGIAIEKDFIKNVEATLAELFPERIIKNMDDRKKNLTLEHILTMRSGMEWDEWKYAYTDTRNHYVKSLTSNDPVQYVLDLPMASEPGVVWNYNGGTSDLLSSLITETSGYDTLNFAKEFLFAPLGITNLTWERDERHGLYYAGFGLNLTPRDMAKFGYLYLHNGEWDGKQIVPADFVAESVKTHSKFSISSGYGYQSWWTYPQEGVYRAAGLDGQRIYVAPELDLVVVFTANIPESNEPERWLRTAMFQYIIPSCNSIVDITE